MTDTVRRLFDGIALGRLAFLLYVIAFFAFILAPIVVVIIISFSPRDVVGFPLGGFSLRWFVRIYEYAPFFDSFVLSVNIAVMAACCAAVIGLPAALALARSKSPVAELVMVFLLSPLAIPAIVIGFSLLSFTVLIGLGISYWSLLIAHTVAALPYIIRTVAGLYRVLPANLEESAAILGANYWRTFLHVILPLLRPAVFAGMVFSMLISIDNISLSFFFGGATTNTLPVVMLAYLENQFDPSIAAVGTIKCAVAVVVLFILDKYYGLGRI